MKKTVILFLIWISVRGAYGASITVSNNQDSGSGSLRNAISAANSGDTVFFSPSLAGQTIMLSSTLEIPVGKNLTIDGTGAPGITISGNNAVRVFLLKSTSVNPTSLTLRGLKIINGLTTEYGAGVRSEHRGMLYIYDCEFRGNNAHKGGSAVFSHFEGRSVIENCLFHQNISIAENDERGSTVMLWGPFDHTVRNCNFTENRAINGGGINGLNAQLTIEHCNFSENKTTDAVNNGGTNPTLRGFGGAIYVDRASPGGSSTVPGYIIIRDCNFLRNEAQSDAGACYIYTDETDSVVIERCNFIENKAYRLTGGSTLTGGGGGAIVQMNNSKNKGFIVRNSAFLNNEADVNCGAIRVDWAETLLENCTFYANKALLTANDGYSANGGALGFYFMEQSTVDIINCTFAQNHAGWVGGAVATTHPENTRVKNSIFYQNTSANGGNNWNIQQHTNNLLQDLGNNLQFPDKFTNNWNDYNVTSSITIADPLLLSPADNGGPTHTMALQAGSPAIDAGSGCPPTDQRGAPRIGPCDIGAFEFGSDPVNLGIANSTADDMLIYPNPGDGTFYLDLPENEIFRVSIFSAEGKMIRTENGPGYNFSQINIPQPGVYFLQIRNEKRNVIQKLIVK